MQLLLEEVAVADRQQLPTGRAYRVVRGRSVVNGKPYTYLDVAEVFFVNGRPAEILSTPIVPTHDDDGFRDERDMLLAMRDELQQMIDAIDAPIIDLSEIQEG